MATDSGYTKGEICDAEEEKMNPIEEKISEALNKLGLPWMVLDFDIKDLTCIYCDKGNTDFCVESPIGMKCFHIDCYTA